MDKESGRVGVAETGSRASTEPVPVSALSGFDPARILFLDMDGVVLSGQELWRTRNNRYLPPEKVALVKEVCDRTGCLIVVSSTWRYSDETRDLLASVGLPLHPNWRTPFGEKTGGLFLGERRGWEIHRWLARHSEVVAYAIVDDDSDMLPEQLSRFVQTPFETGLERHHVEQLVALLCDSDGSGEADETGTGSAQRATARA